MTTQREGLLEKIRGLLAKTLENGCTESEAMAALDKARAMMDAYAVSESELSLTKDEKAILRREPPGTKDPHRIKWHLMSAVVLRLPKLAQNPRARLGVLRPAIGRTIRDVVARYTNRIRSSRNSQAPNGR
jgi:Protein of unknown function (DUF2786)